MFHAKRVPTDAVGILVAEASAKRFTSVEAVDAALEVAGCANAYRAQGGDAPPVLFGSSGPPELADVPDDEDEAADLAEQVRGHFSKVGADATHTEPARFGGVLQLVMPLVMFVLRKWVENRLGT